MELKNILLTTDFSDSARKAYPAAVSLAKRFDARLHLVHVAEGASQFYFSAEGFGGALTSGDFHADLEKHLKKEAREPAFAEVDVAPFLVTGSHLVAGIRSFEEKHRVDLAILASRGRSGLGYAFLGSSAEKIVRGTSAPVLTCRPPEEGAGAFAPQSVLVPYDFSENASAVLPAIRFLAEAFTPQFVFFFAIEPVYPFFGETAGHASYEFIQQTIKDAPKFAKTKFEELRQEDLAGVNVRLEFGDGVPSAEIIDRAKSSRTDLVVMATHGWTGFRHFFLGSVAETVVRKVSCSVLTVRSAAES